MNEFKLWLAASSAAEIVDVHPDTINRRAFPHKASPDAPVPGKIRYKMLKLGADTRMERRYYRPDVEAMLVE